MPLHVLFYQLPYVLKRPRTKKVEKSRKPVETTLVPGDGLFFCLP